MSLLLIVDDDDLIRTATAAVLARLGHDTIRAKDGLEALTIYKAKYHEIDLVIMDIMMPKMDGIAAMRAIKGVHPSAKVILMSGYSDQDLPSEADAFLAKPFRNAALCETVDQVLKKA